MTAIAALAAALRGEAADVSDLLVDAAEAHGVDGLVACAPAAASAPPGVRFRLKATLAGYEALSALRDLELAGVLDHLASGGVSTIVIKGAHLAHTIYASPALRPRGDTDLVIAEAAQPAAASSLQHAGYRRKVHVRGALILGQCHFERTDRFGIVHALDVHWRVAAPLVFRHVLPAGTLWASRVPMTALGAHAWGPSRPHALLIACVHLVAHHRADPLLVWLYDIARLAQALDADEAGTFVETAAAARISLVCASALDRARAFFDGPALESLAARAHAQADGRAEPSARLLTAARPIDEMWLDLRVSNGWGERIALLREHVWPDAEYMRATTAKTGWLPLAYARRAFRGARKWIAPGGSKVPEP
jgi:putative nucleotidyltransferase-like protein